MRGAGQGSGRERQRVRGSGQRGGRRRRLVRNKSKTNCAPRLLVLFYVQSKLFCTDAGFAPTARVPRVPSEGRPEGSQAEGLAGLYPPIEVYGWDDRGF